MRVSPLARSPRPMSVIVLPLLLVLAATLAGAPALGGPNANGTLVVHDTGLTYTSEVTGYPSAPPTTDPPTVDNQLPVDLPPDTEGWVWKVYAAFPTGSSPRLKALVMGELFPPGVQVLAGGLPDPVWDFEIPQGGWPTTSGGGVGISFGHVQTAWMIECYWFGGYGAEGTSWAVAPHPVQAMVFVDDAIPPHEDPIVGLSTIGFGIDGTTVYPPPLPQPGACCYPDGRCESRLEVECAGVFQGEETPCEPNPCPQPPHGACCFDDGRCEFLTEASCPGIWHGAGTDCAPNPCPQPGACCFSNGACQLLVPNECQSEGGVVYGGACQPNPCPPPPPTGACCFPGGSCSIMSASACAAAGGTYHGGSCSPNPCPQPPPTGACCFSDGSCVTMTPSNCQAAGGSYYGGACSPNPCGGHNPCGAPAPGPLVEEGAELRQGGDTCGSATIIPGLPYYDSGVTTGFVNDYDEVCPYTGSTSPDVVYQYTAPADMTMSIDLCASQYDTKLYVYSNSVGNLVACSDDAGCGYSGWQSAITDLLMCAGYTYYFVVDGYGGASGSYAFSILAYAPCVVECPAGSLMEGEPGCVDGYYDQYNGGCNTTGWMSVAAQTDGCADLCGIGCTYIYQGLSYRDTDWYQAFALGGPLTYTCTAEFSLATLLIYGLNCQNLQYIYATGSACQPVTQIWNCEPNQEIWLWAASTDFSGVPASSYVMRICGIQSWATPVEEMSWGRIKATFSSPPAGEPDAPEGKNTHVAPPIPRRPTPEASSGPVPGRWSARPVPKPSHPQGR